jgi:hypothetical protein
MATRRFSALWNTDTSYTRCLHHGARILHHAPIHDNVPIERIQSIHTLQTNNHTLEFLFVPHTPIRHINIRRIPHNIQNSRQEKYKINFQFLGSFVINGFLIRRQTQWKDTRRIFQGIGQMLISFGVILYRSSM